MTDSGFSLAEQRVLVTGASSGIGAASLDNGAYRCMICLLTLQIMSNYSIFF